MNAELRAALQAAVPQADVTDIAGGTFYWGYRAGWNAAREAMQAALAATPEPLDVERLARALPDVMDRATTDYIYGPEVDPLDTPEEWYMTPREMAEAIAAAYAEDK